MAYMAYMAHMAAMVFILPTRWVKEIKCQTATRSHDSPLYRLVGTWWTVCSVFSLSGSRYKLRIFLTNLTEFSPFSPRACSASADSSHAATSCAVVAGAAGTSNFFVQKNKTFLLLLRKVTYKTFSAAAAASAKIQTETLVEEKRLR